MGAVLENECLRVVFTDNGGLASLFDKRSQTEYAREHGLWRLIINEGESLEIEVNSRDAAGRVSIDGNRFRIDYSGARTHTGHEVDIPVTVTGTLQGENLSMDISLENRMAAPGNLIRECHFPIICLGEAALDMEFHNSEFGGAVWDSVRKMTEEMAEKPYYMAMEYVYARKVNHYPDLWAAMNFYLLTNHHRSFYLASQDPEFVLTEQVLELENWKQTNLLFVKMPFLAPGGKTTITGYVWSPCQGDWTVAADKYRAWAETWFNFTPVPEKIRTMQGWQRVIMRSQYGENFFKFDKLPQIYEDGIKAGIDTLFMFGWHKGGHDCDYPNYVVSDDLGGKDLLKANIAEFKARGGKVNLYSNGQLIDMNSDFYQHGEGKKVSIKNHRGHEPLQFYGFRGRGIFNQVYGNRTFCTACPSQTAWHDQLKKVADTAAELGCDGVFYDQLGASSNLCCDSSHGHETPYFKITAARRDMVKKLRDYAHSRGLTFGIELISDITAQHTDYIHSLNGGANFHNLELFRYVFPEVVISNREIRDDRDIERRVNRMLLLNVVSDVEIYRCQKTIAETPHYQEYLGKVNAFRQKHGDLLFGAKFRANALHICDNPEMQTAGHIAPDGSVVVLATNEKPTAGRITVPGYSLVESDILGAGSVRGNLVSLERYAVALLVFRK